MNLTLILYMLLPIFTYGNPVLKQETTVLTKDYPELSALIANMRETMKNAEGVGLAAPQVGLPIRLFVVDLSALGEDDSSFVDFRKTFINPLIVERSAEEAVAEEGCLSIPGVSENVSRPVQIKIQYLDENFEAHEEEYTDFAARVIQHEYDHLETTLYVDRISGIRKQLIKNKLNSIMIGKVRCNYKIKTVKQ